MEFKKLSPKSENMLLEIVQSENPTHTLKELFRNASNQHKNVLLSTLKELELYGLITIKWAEDMPYIVKINNSAQNYIEQLRKFKPQKRAQIKRRKDKKIVFISHRSTDRDIVNMSVDFLIKVDIPYEINKQKFYQVMKLIKLHRGLING